LVEIIILLIAAYLVGSIPVAYLAIKAYRGVDIRNYGSGGVGGSNVFRNFSKPLGLLVGIFDAGKGALMVWIARLLGMDTAAQVAIGTAVVVGHNWSLFMRFNAGRGVATTLGIDIILMPWLTVIIGAVILIIFIIGSSPVPVLIGMALLPLFSWIFHGPLAITLGLIGLFLIMVIRRLTAPRTDRSTRIDSRELLLNRLLYDRDIRDGKEWIKFKRSPNSSK
jgi:glycerol-3-phosphate acyltransferase PlsY